MRQFVPLALNVLALGGVWSLAAQPTSTPDANLPSFELRRGERPITVQQTATDAEGGIAITRAGPDCRQDENLSFYYAPAPKRIETTVDNTQIRSSVVFRTQPKEGGAEAQDRAVLEFFGGSLSVNDETLCPRNVRRDAEARVTIIEGRTTVRGGPLRYENRSGVGEMQGPVNLKRRATEDSPALTASSAFLSFNVDSDLQTLRGGVRVESDGRTSEADSLVLDEEAGFVVLRGSPARSRDSEGEVMGETIEYDLDTNDVVVTQGVEGSFTLDLGDEEPARPSLDGIGEDDTDAETGEDDESGDDGSSDAPPDDSGLE